MGFYGTECFLNEGLLDKIKEKKKQKEQEKEEKRKAQDYENLKELVKNTANWIKNPKTLGDGYDIDILYTFTKIKSLNELFEFCNKNKNKFDKINILNDFFGGEEEKSKKYIKFFGTFAYEILENDDYAICLGPNGKLYNLYLSDDEISLIKIKDLNVTGNDYSIDELKRADKELGTKLFN